MTYIDRMAAQHALTLRDAEASGEAIQSALDWIDHDQGHLAAFNRIERFLHACDGIDRDDVAHLAPAPMRPRSLIGGFGWLPVALAASLLMLVIAVGAFLSWPGSATFQEAHFQTPRDVIRSIRLADGSNVTLAGASAVSISFGEKTRSVRLLSGEALFAVAPDAARTFTVQTQNGTTTAIGTAFNVHRGAGDTTVTVLHGRVEVVASGHGYNSRATLDRAMEVRYSRDGEMSAIRRVDLEAIASWRRGEFRFADAPLASVVEDLNRYSAKPIILDDPALRQMTISGVVTADGILEWLGSLPAIADVQIVETSREIRIRSRRERKVTRI